MFGDLHNGITNEVNFLGRDEIVEVHSSPAKLESVVSFSDK